MSKIKIGAITYRIRMEHVDDAMARVIWKRSLIKVQKDMEKRITQETLLHEVMHIAFVQSGHDGKADEGLIDALAYTLLDSGLIDKKKLGRLLK